MRSYLESQNRLEMYDTQAILKGFTGEDARIPKLHETSGKFTGGSGNNDDGDGDDEKWMILRGKAYKAVSFFFQNRFID